MHSKLITMGAFLLLLMACYHPPYNDFKPEYPLVPYTAAGTAVGAIVGAAASAPLTGVGIGAAGGVLVGLYNSSKPKIIQDMRKQDIELIEYQHKITLILPTDHYFKFNSPKFHELQFRGLAAMMAFIRLYPYATFHVAVFSDRVGSVEESLKLGEARAHTMLTFLYANGVPVEQLTAQSIGPYFAIGDHALIHGSAYNRRLEIQWDTRENPKGCCRQHRS